MTPTMKDAPPLTPVPVHEEEARPRGGGPPRVDLTRRPKELTPAPPLALAMTPPKDLVERVADLEHHIPRLELVIHQGFEKQRDQLFLPIVGRLDDMAKASVETDKKVTAVQSEVEKHKSLLWWAGKGIEKLFQLLSLAGFGYMWFKDSALAGKISTFWFKFFGF